MTVISDNGMLALNQFKNKIKIIDLATQKQITFLVARMKF